MNTINLILDTREKYLINLFQKNNKEFTTKQLDIGDIHFIQNDKEICIIERKTMEDLAASIKDSRAREQKARLLDYTKSNGVLLIYLIEGNFIDSSMNENILMSSIINKIVRDQIYVLRSRNLNESYKFILKLQDKLDKFNKPESIDYVSTLKPKKSENLTPESILITQLSCIPRISYTLAKCITDNYPSMSEIINGIDSIENLTYELKTKDKNGNYKKRKIGKAVSDNLKYFLKI